MPLLNVGAFINQINQIKMAEAKKEAELKMDFVFTTDYLSYKSGQVIKMPVELFQSYEKYGKKATAGEIEAWDARQKKAIAEVEAVKAAAKK